jgi:hypothetical protein
MKTKGITQERVKEKKCDEGKVVRNIYGCK